MNSKGKEVIFPKEEEVFSRWGNWDMQNGYHHTPNKGTPHCEGEHASNEKEEHTGGHHRRKRAESGR